MRSTKCCATPRCGASSTRRPGHSPSKESAIYAGVTLDLERRLRALLEGCRLRPVWMPFAKFGRLFVQTVVLDASDGDKWISELAPHQSRLVADFSPLLNFKVLLRA